jgi:hypothetical protein
VRGGLVGDGADYPRESAVRKPIRFGVGLRRHGVRGCRALLLCLATGSADLRASTPRHHVALGWHCGMRTSRPWRSDRSAWLFFPLRSQAYLRRRRRRAYADRWHKDRRASAFPARCNMQHASRNTQHTPHVTCSTQRTVSASARKSRSLIANAGRARVRGAFWLCCTDGCARLGGQAAKHDRPITHSSPFSV